MLGYMVPEQPDKPYKKPPPEMTPEQKEARALWKKTHEGAAAARAAALDVKPSTPVENQDRLTREAWEKENAARVAEKQAARQRELEAAAVPEKPAERRPAQRRP